MRDEKYPRLSVGRRLHKRSTSELGFIIPTDHIDWRERPRLTERTDSRVQRRQYCTRTTIEAATTKPSSSSLATQKSSAKREPESSFSTILRRDGDGQLVKCDRNMGISCLFILVKPKIAEPL